VDELFDYYGPVVCSFEGCGVVHERVVAAESELGECPFQFHGDIVDSVEVLLTPVVKDRTLIDIADGCFELFGELLFALLVHVFNEVGRPNASLLLASLHLQIQLFFPSLLVIDHNQPLSYKFVNNVLLVQID